MDQYHMPPIHIGEVVVWKPSTSENSPTKTSVGIVTRVGDRSIAMTCIWENIVLEKTGVRHVSDPKIIPAEAAHSGYWEHMPWRAREISLLERIEEMLSEHPRELPESEAATAPRRGRPPKVRE